MADERFKVSFRSTHALKANGLNVIDSVCIRARGAVEAKNIATQYLTENSHRNITVCGVTVAR